VLAPATLPPLTSSPTVATHEETATNNPDNTNTLAKATKIFKEKSPKADKIMSLIVDTKAVKMSVHHVVKAKAEKMFDGKADKMSVHQNAEAKAEKIVDAKADMMTVYHEAKAEKMSVHHLVVKAKTEKIVDTKAVKMSIHHDAAKAKMTTEKMFDRNGKAGKKHLMSIHSYGAKSTKGVLVHNGMFQLRN
jgi:hypothetical protein